MADTTYSGVYQTTCLQVARDMVSGYFGNYIFYRANNYYYWLVKYKRTETIYDGEQQGTRYLDCDVTVIQWIPHDGQSIQDDCWVWHNNALSVDFYNPDQQLYYASEGMMPRLQGGETYAAFGCMCLLGIIGAFVLLRRLFSFVCS